jgi:hypothetical protein
MAWTTGSLETSNHGWVLRRLKDSRDCPGISGLWQSIGSHVFSVAFFATEEELLTPEGDGVRLLFGNITLAERVLNHFFTRILGFCNFSFGRGKGMFDHPIDRQQNN